MDQVSADDTARDNVRSRRRRMRDTARGLHPAGTPSPDGFQTPEWLERSFVLPLTEPEVGDVPNQPVPHHDDYEDDLLEVVSSGPDPEPAEPAPTFVRPPTKEIDFARVIRRSDLSRSATRTALGSTGVAGLILIAYLLTRSPVVLGMAIAFAMIAVVSLGVRLRLATAPIPHLDR